MEGPDCLCMSLSFLVHGSWGLWSEWSECDACVGESVRKRECNSPPARFGGLPCHGESLQSHGCHDNQTICSGQLSSYSVSCTQWGAKKKVIFYTLDNLYSGTLFKTETNKYCMLYTHYLYVISFKC